MNLEKLFTSYDESLLIDSTRDVMGFEVIWSTLGKKIFHSTLTTVANDMRNFTLNFFNHAVIYTLLDNKQHIMKWNMQKFFPQPDGPDFKLAAVLLLENIFSLKCAEADTKNISKEVYKPDAVLGRNAAGAILRDQGSIDNINLVFHQQSGFLVRQNQLGVHGRYKSPFREMKIFTDRQLGYNTEKFKLFLERDEELSNAVTETAEQLFDELNSCLFTEDVPEYFKDLQQLKIPLPYIPYNNLQEIGNRIFDLFKGYETVKHFQEFWLEQLGICGDSISYKIFDLINTKGYMDRTIFEILAQESISKTEEVKQIREIEPWLSFCLYLFNGLVHSDAKDVEDVINTLQLGENINKIQFRPNLIEDQRLFNTRYTSIIDIISSARNHNYKEVIEKLVIYQKDIMNKRGASPLLSIKDNVIKSLYPSSAKFYGGKEFDPKKYQHSYYINAVKQLAKGMRS